MDLAIGDLAPQFILNDDSNRTISLHDYRGENVILYFYPKDNTPGCTQEACDFRDAFPHFQNKNAVVLGISKDNAKKHASFKEKYTLPFTLLADTEGKVCIAYGVLNPKSLFGKTFLGIQRSTFLIDKEGVIRGIWRKVKVGGHAEAVLNSLHEIST